MNKQPYTVIVARPNQEHIETGIYRFFASTDAEARFLTSTVLHGFEFQPIMCGHDLLIDEPFEVKDQGDFLILCKERVVNLKAIISDFNDGPNPTYGEYFKSLLPKLEAYVEEMKDYSPE